MNELDPELAMRADALGVATAYLDWAGVERPVAVSTVEKVVALLDTDLQSPDDHGDGAASPRCLDLPPGRLWGWQVQLYGMRSSRSWGIGDLADLRRLAEWSSHEFGADFILVNPLHAVVPGLPQEDSPYSPSSRRFTNPLYLALDEVPEVARLSREDRISFHAAYAAARALNATELIDRDEVYRYKRAAWELLICLALDAHREADFNDYCHREGAALDDFAVFCALAEVHGTPWQSWPAALQRPDAAAVAHARMSLRHRVQGHRRLQWLCDEQLAEVQRAARSAGMAVGVVHDLAVGADPGGADAWAMQDSLALDYTIGAPPDSFNQRGQTWALPPPRPDRLRETACAQFRDMVRTLLRHAGGLRIDHALGLWRLWWVPEGEEASGGTYVQYPADALLDVLAEESQRAGAVIVAEDLGTVPQGVPEALRRRAVASSAVLWFEREDDGRMRPSSSYPDWALASVTTHDLHTARGFWRGCATTLRRELGLFPSPSAADSQERADDVERSTLQQRLTEDGLVGPEPTEEELVLAMHQFVARSPARLCAVSLGDAVGEVRQPNLPGTIDEYPNWRFPLADVHAQQVSLEALFDHEGARRLANAVRAGRHE